MRLYRLIECSIVNLCSRVNTAYERKASNEPQSEKGGQSLVNGDLFKLLLRLRLSGHES